jgi:hypothetical protein
MFGVCNVGLAISFRVGAAVENAAPKRVFSAVVSLSPCDWDFLVHTVSYETKLSRDVDTISVEAVVSLQLTP